MKDWALNDIDEQLINLALQEDLGIVFDDVTTKTLFKDKNPPGTATIISKHPTPLVFCGEPLIEQLMACMQAEYGLHGNHNDGHLVQPHSEIFSITADVQTLLMIERTLLNFIRHLSAVATLTHTFVEKVTHTDLKILDTRKTTPGFRHLEKYAVHCGGGVNHRMGLYDAIMIKDTHVDFIGGMEKALAQLPEKNDIPVIVEVRNLEELNTVIMQGRDKVQRVLLDNMSLEHLRICVKLCKGLFETEASGNLTLEKITVVAETGVQFASVGLLTHSAPAVDISMKIMTHD